MWPWRPQALIVGGNDRIALLEPCVEVAGISLPPRDPFQGHISGRRAPHRLVVDLWSRGHGTTDIADTCAPSCVGSSEALRPMVPQALATINTRGHIDAIQKYICLAG